MWFADGLAVDFDPGVRGERLGAHAGAPGRPAAPGPAVERGRDGALQAPFAGAAQAAREPPQRVPSASTMLKIVDRARRAGPRVGVQPCRGGAHGY